MQSKQSYLTKYPFHESVLRMPSLVEMEYFNNRFLEQESSHYFICSLVLFHYNAGENAILKRIIMVIS